MANKTFVCADNLEDKDYRVKFNNEHPPMFYRANSVDGWIDIWYIIFCKDACTRREYGKVKIYHKDDYDAGTMYCK